MKLKDKVIKVVSVVFATILGAPLAFLAFIMIGMIITLIGITIEGIFFNGLGSDNEIVKEISYKAVCLFQGEKVYKYEIYNYNTAFGEHKYWVKQIDGDYNLIMFTFYDKTEEVMTNCSKTYYEDDDAYYIMGNDEYAILYKEESEKGEYCKVLLKKDNKLRETLSKCDDDDFELLDDFSQFTKTEKEKLLYKKSNGEELEEHQMPALVKK